MSESLLLRNQRDDQIRNSGPIEATLIDLVQPSEKIIILHVEAEGHRGKEQPSEDKVHANTRVLKLNDGNMSITNRFHIFNSTGR